MLSHSIFFTNGGIGMPFFTQIAAQAIDILFTEVYPSAAVATYPLPSGK